jgi:hypothetical protein
MPQHLVCPACHQTIQAADESAGGVVRCCYCGQAIHVPIPAPPRVSLAQRSISGQRERRESSGSAYLVLALVSVAFAALTLVIMILPHARTAPPPVAADPDLEFADRALRQAALASAEPIKHNREIRFLAASKIKDRYLFRGHVATFDDIGAIMNGLEFVERPGTGRAKVNWKLARDFGEVPLAPGVSSLVLTVDGKYERDQARLVADEWRSMSNRIPAEDYRQTSQMLWALQTTLEAELFDYGEPVPLTAFDVHEKWDEYGLWRLALRYASDVYEYEVACSYHRETAVEPEPNFMIYLSFRPLKRVANP